ncbi:MAG: CPBP family intramembrane metalloprotease [Chlorobi bacterium]|nr:CPBP family intramembrane metalloprotease [Chlorobiota bacterium]
MKHFGFLQNLSPWGKIFLLTALIMMSALLTAFGGLLIGKLVFGVSLESVAAMLSNPVTPRAIAYMKFYQLINQLGFFIIPVFLFTFLISPSPSGYLTLNRSPGGIALLISALVIYSVLPFNHFLTELNMDFKFPGFLHSVEEWMKAKEIQAGKITETILKTRTYSGLAVNLVVVALIPAFGEELLFRATGINLLKELTKNVHWAIIISSFVFAFLHFQFLSFLPRFLLGMLLGYLFVITKNIWIPVFAHFVNNASSIIIFYLYYNGSIEISMDDFGATQNTVYIIGSLLITLWLMFMLYHKEGANRTGLG